MATVTQVAEAMQRVLNEVAEKAGEESGFIKRRRKLTGASFVQTLVFGWQSNGEASLGELNQTAAAVGVEITGSGLDQRFGPEAVVLLRQVLEAAVEEIIAAEPVAIPLLRRFNGVHLHDSSQIILPETLAAIWPGCGNSRGETAAIKLQVDWNFSDGALHQLGLQAGRMHDQHGQAQEPTLPPGALRIADLGYFNLGVLAAEAEEGVFWLSRLKMGTAVYDVEGHPLDLGHWLSAQETGRVDVPILLGSKHHIRCRLLAVRVPPEVAAERRRKVKRDAQKKGQTVSQARLALADWTLLITNVPVDQLSLEEALVLYGVRWQIELLFKLWKSEGLLAQSRSHNPWRILCEVFAKLLALIIQHWLFLTGFWAFPDRSLTKAAHTVQAHSLSLALACRGSRQRLIEVIHAISRCLAAGCRMNPRRARPNTYQKLLAFDVSALT